MTLQELQSFIEIQGEVEIQCWDKSQGAIFYTDDFQYCYNISDDILNMYVKYIYHTENCMVIEVSKEN